jgi:hypothetical protein
MANIDIQPTGTTEIRSGPPVDAPRIAAFSRLAHVVESAAQVDAPEPAATITEIALVHGRFDAYRELRDKAMAELEETEAEYRDARRSATEAWAGVREEEQRLAETVRAEEAAARDLEEARQRRRAAERRLRRSRSDAELASRHCSDVSRSLQDAQLRAERR